MMLPQYSEAGLRAKMCTSVCCARACSSCRYDRAEGGDAEDADAFGQQAVGRGLEGLFEPVPHFYAVGRGLAVV